MSQQRSVDYNRFLSQVAREREDLSSLLRAKTRPDNIPLSFGYPYSESFAIDELSAAAAASLADEGHLTLQYGGGPSAEALRQYLMGRAERRGIDRAANDMVLTAGSMQAIDLIGRTVVDRGDMLMAEAPTYFGALRIFQTWGAQIVGFPIDEHGLDTSVLATQLASWRAAGRALPKLLYTIPNFHNPGGVTMSLARRQALLKLAGEYDFLVVEDDAYGELRFSGEDIPSLKALDVDGRVIQTGTFSKIVAPGVRLGWAVGPKPLVDLLSKLNMGGGLSTFVMGILHAFCRDGDLDKRIDELRTGYRLRKEAMVASLETHMPRGITWNNPDGGFFVWIEVPAEVDMDVLAERAREDGVTYVAGTAFFTDGQGRNCARLCFSFCDPETLDRGISRLAGLIREELGQ